MHIYARSCVHIYVHIHVHCTHICTHICPHTCTHIFNMYVYIHALMHECMYTFKNTIFSLMYEKYLQVPIFFYRFRDINISPPSAVGIQPRVLQIWPNLSLLRKSARVGQQVVPPLAVARTADFLLRKLQGSLINILGSFPKTFNEFSLIKISAFQEFM